MFLHHRYFSRVYAPPIHIAARPLMKLDIWALASIEEEKRNKRRRGKRWSKRGRRVFVVVYQSDCKTFNIVLGYYLGHHRSPKVCKRLLDYAIVDFF
jgi:hypothetical protein